jgi:hypothetical protein
MQSPKASHTLKLSLEIDQVPCTNNNNPFDMLSSTSSSSSVMGDYNGMESCLDIEDEEEVHALKAAESGAYNKCRGKRDQRLAMIKKKKYVQLVKDIRRSVRSTNHLEIATWLADYSSAVPFFLHSCPLFVHYEIGENKGFSSSLIVGVIP